MRLFLRSLLIISITLTFTSLFVYAQGNDKDKQDMAKKTMKLMEEGSSYFQQGDLKKAIGPYSKALENEKQQPALEKDLWRVLVDNLGMAYGITGDLAKAKVTFEYGISKDKEYPMFYYNLACTYGEMGKLDETITNLKLAFQYKNNMIAGEKMPNPEGDTSFAKFLKEEKFIQALKEINAK